jgi:hypothetical protein
VPNGTPQLFLQQGGFRIMMRHQPRIWEEMENFTLLDAMFDEAPKLERLTVEERSGLREQIIDELQPGAIVHDFQAMLDFVADKALPVAGKNNLLPIKVLADLNERMHEPLRVGLRRPQLKSYPNLQQLYLLLRGTGLGIVQGPGKPATLHLDPDLLASWNRLNATERYFNLLEAFVDRADPAILGNTAGGIFRREPIQNWLLTWQALGSRRDSGGPNQPCDRDFVTYHAGALAMMWLFGLIDVEQGAPDGKTGVWAPRRAHRTAFGGVMLKFLRAYRLLRLSATCGMPLTLETPTGVEECIVDDMDADDAADESPFEESPLGKMQPPLQPLFPQWQNNLTTPPREARNGQYLVKVSLGKSIWRRLSISSEATFEILAEWILRAFELDDDHLYELTFKDASGRSMSVMDPRSEQGLSAADVNPPIGCLRCSSRSSIPSHGQSNQRSYRSTASRRNNLSTIGDPHTAFRFVTGIGVRRQKKARSLSTPSFCCLLFANE